jgi:hypothetical protein
MATLAVTKHGRSVRVTLVLFRNDGIAPLPFLLSLAQTDPVRWVLARAFKISNATAPTMLSGAPHPSPK